MLRTVASRIAAATPLGLIPVTVRRGPARGARWTLAPFSENWRSGGENSEVDRALRLFPSPKGLVFWDLGAHFGIHAIGVALNVGHRGEVVAVEPDPIAFLRLQRHVAMNRLTNVKLIQAAASNESGFKLLIGGNGSSASRICAEQQSDHPTQRVRSVAMDDLVRQGDIREPDLIKIDIEGYAGTALAGMQNALRAKRPIIACSLHSTEEVAAVKAALEPLGYSPRNIVTGAPQGWSAEAAVVMFRADEPYGRGDRAS